jgi:hypothetical protein
LDAIRLARRAVPKIDVTLRDIFHHRGRGFLRELGLEGRFTPLPTEFPSTKDRRVDLLGLLECPDGTRVLAHIEFQSEPDPEMVERMLEYDSVLSRWRHQRNSMGEEPPLPESIVQKLVYVGKKNWKARTVMDGPGIHFEFEFVDVRRLSSRRLSADGDDGDALIALLCAGGSNRDMIQAIVDKISCVPEREQADLGALAGLRDVQALVEQEITAMPITVNIEDIPLLREPFERAQARSREQGLEEGLAKGRQEGLAEGHQRGLAKGRAAGLAEAIDRLLQQKFVGDVPAGLAEHLAKLPPAVLDEILDNCATASSVSDALGRYAPKGE